MRLTMVNGPCGVGKSTASTLMAELTPDSLLLPIGAVRDTMPPLFFDEHTDDPDSWVRMWEANRHARSFAKLALFDGRDVIVDNVKYQSEWVEPWENLCHELGAEVLDLCILAPKNIVLERASKRGYVDGGRLTPEKVSILYDKVIMFYRNRPNALFLDSQALNPSELANLVNNYDIDENVAYPDMYFEAGRTLYARLLEEVLAQD
jgi:predicted kinase